MARLRTLASLQRALRPPLTAPVSCQILLISPLAEAKPPAVKEAGAGSPTPPLREPPHGPAPTCGHDAGVVGLLVLVHLQVALADEALLLLGADG